MVSYRTSTLAPLFHSLVAITVMTSASVWAQTRIDSNGISQSGSVIGNDVLYSIGGGRAVSMGRVANMQSIGVGIGWNSNLICGDMNLVTTVQNQLNGITRGFQTLMGVVIQNATQAVASLPALLVQRAAPDIYNLLTNGILIINDAKALVHTVADTVYLVSPGVFMRYAQEQPKVTLRAKQEKLPEWEWVQKRFEQLHLHKKQPSGLNIWTCEVTGPRKSRRLHGYLLAEPSVLIEHALINNPYLSLKQA